MDRRRSLLKIAALRSEREQQVGVNCTKGYLESTDAGLLFDGPRSMECFFNLRQSDGTQRPAQFSTSMLAIAVTPMDAIMFHCGDKSLQVSRVTIGDDIHAVISYDGATAMCYINGIEVGAMQPTAYTPSALFRIGDPLHITKSPVHFCRHFNYALSAEEVAALYNDGDPAGYIVPKSRRLQATPYIRLMAPMTTDGWSSYNAQSIPPTIVDGALAVTYPTETGQGYNNGIWRRLSVNVENDCYFLLKFKAKADDDNTRIASFVGVGSGLPYYKHDVIASTSFTEYYAVFKNTRGVPMTSIGFYPIFNTSGNGKFYIKDVSVTSIGLIAEYLPQNLVGQWHEKPFEITGITTYTWTGETDPVYYQELLLGRFIQTGAVVMIKGSVSDYQSGEPFVYVGNRQAMIPAQNGSFTLKVINNRDNIDRIYYYGGTVRSDRRLTITIDSVELIPDVALSWLDSAKQFPLNDEYLPPLLQSDGGYDLAANGTPQIIIK
ncbi:hypothetical protein [Alistipes putredinis]|uniref:hypothetical protein n=1 Tax=Alistipes putredinis TaxID=28117 RepID=UPI003AB6DE41